MNKTVTKSLSKNLEALYKDSEAARIFFDHAADRQKAVAYTSVERAVSVTGCNKSEINDLFRKLSDMNAGEYKVGRRGSKTRIVWHYSINTIGLSAQGHMQEPVDIDAEFDVVDDEEEEDESGLVSHSFQLRPGYTVALTLPQDLTAREADRLAAFVKSLPFE